MTILCGDPNFTGYSVGSSSSDGGYVPAIPYIASKSGMATSIYSWITPGSATTFVMGLYDGVSQNLVYSAPITVQAPGLVQFPIAPTRVVALSAYVVLLISSTGSFQFGVDAVLPVNANTSAFANSNFPQPLFQLNGGKASPYPAPAFYVDGDTQARSIFSSGTVGQTVLDTGTLIQRAMNRAGIRQNIISDEMVSVAQDELFMFLTSDLANRGIQLFAVDIVTLPFVAGVANVQMPAGTIDVLQANFRSMNPLQTGSSNSYFPASPTQVNSVAITWGGPATLIDIQSNQSGGFQTLLQANVNASAGETTFHDLDGGQPASGWQVIADPLAPMPLNVTNVTFYATLSMVPMAPYSRDDFANLSNLFFPGRPFQYWLDRQEPWPIMRLWPVPTANEQANACLVVFRQKHIQDVGTLAQRLAVPVRWTTAVVDNLAYRLCKILTEANKQLLPALKADAAESLSMVREEEREKAPFRIRPNIARYTR